MTTYERMLDNAWTEEFPDRLECLKWLLREPMEDYGREEAAG